MKGFGDWSVVRMYAVNSSGVAGSKLVSDNYYDRNASIVATVRSGSAASEYAYDGAGRSTRPARLPSWKRPNTPVECSIIAIRCPTSASAA